MGLQYKSVDHAEQDRQRLLRHADELRGKEARLRNSGTGRDRDITDLSAKAASCEQLADQIGDWIGTQPGDDHPALKAMAVQTMRGPDGPVTVDPEPERLTKSQSLVGWLERKGQLGAGGGGLSFDRYLRALVGGDWREAGLEGKALSEGTLTAGGHLVPTPLAARVIDLARNQMRVMQAGAVTVPMSAQTLKVPRLTGEGTPAWHAENAAITDADLVFDAVTFTARTLTRLVKLSVELFEDSDPSAEGVIAQSFAGQIALEVDRVALRGTGTAPEPRGVLNTSGITTTAHGANGALIATATAYDWHLDAAGVVRGNNFDPGAHIQAPRTSTSLSKLREATTSAYLAPPPNMLPMLPTKQVPTNLTVGTSNDCSEIYTGAWEQLMFGVRSELRIMFLRERYIDNGQYGFLAWLRGDVQLAQPSAFVVDVGVRG